MGAEKGATTTPPRWRVLIAFIVAPLVPTLTLAALSPLYGGLPMMDRIMATAVYIAVFGAYPFTVLFGLPAYFLLRGRVAPSPVNCAAVGAAIAALPVLFLAMLANPDYAFSNGHVTHENGARTLAGWGDLLVSVGQLGALGALGGVVFWAIAVAGMRSKRPSEQPPT